MRTAADIIVPGEIVDDDDAGEADSRVTEDEALSFQEELERIASAERAAANDADLVRLC